MLVVRRQRSHYHGPGCASSKSLRSKTRSPGTHKSEIAEMGIAANHGFDARSRHPGVRHQEAAPREMHRRSHHPADAHGTRRSSRPSASTRSTGRSCPLAPASQVAAFYLVPQQPACRFVSSGGNASSSFAI
jgi:hypothetical protein